MANEVDPIIIDVGFKEDASIQDVITHLSTVKEKMEDIGDGSKGSTAFLDQLGLTDMGRQEIITTLGTMITGLSGVGETLTSIPAHLAQSFSVLKSEITGIETLLNSVNGKQKSLVNDSNKGMQSIQHMMMSVAGMSAQSQNVTEFAKAFRGATEASIGWSAQDLARYAPQVVSMVLEPAVRRIQAENKHGIGFNGIVSSIMRDNNNVAYLQNLAKLSGHENGMSKEQVQANYEMMLRGWTPYAMSTGAASKLLDWKARGVYETKQQALRVEDRFTKDANDYQKLIFSGYGKNDYVERQAADYIKSQGGSPIRSYTKRRQSGLQELHRFLQQGNNMDELFPLLQEAGIATVNNKGQYQIFNNIREQQLQYLRARALQEYSNALRSDAPYEGNPTDVLSAGRMTGRQGRRPTLYLGLNNALPEDVIPSLAGFDKKTMSGYGGKINTGISIGKTPTLARYYIPQTSIDFGTGKAVVRNNFWQKDLAKGIEQRPDDEQVAITDSLIARMFGMEGDRTLGFGHDEKTGAIRRTTKVVGADGKTRDVELTPNLFTADFSKFITYDEEKGKYVVDKTHPDYKRAERILSGQELVDYGVNPQTGKAEKYRFLYSKDDGRAIFGKESIAQEIEARYAAAHLPSPFKYGNDRENGILFDDNAKTIKQINAMAKMASSGTAIEDLMSPEQANKLKNATGIYANFEMMYDILDDMEKESGGKYTGKWSKIMGRRMDGLAFGDPTIFSKDFQGRFGAGTDKFAMGAYDWRPMLLAGWEAGRKLNSRLYGYDETYDPNYNGPNKDQYEKEHRAIWAPTGGASKEDYAKIRQYISGKGENGQDITEDELADLRRQYFTNTVAKEAGYIIDRSASKSGSGYRTMSLENFWNGKEGFFTKADYEQALADNRIKNGEVQLLPWQQEKFRREYAALAMPGKSGFIEMKNEGDMFSDKDFIPESVLRGVNAPQEVFEKSERLYKQRLDELNTTAGRIKQFQGDANAMEAIANDPSWVWNDHTAVTHIEQTRRALEARRARHEVLTEGNREGNIAVGTVGQLAEIFQAMTGMSDEDYGQFKSLLPEQMEKNNAVFSKGVSSSVIDMLTRFPFASGQYMMDVNNYAQAAEVDDYLDSLDKLKTTQNRLGKLRRRNDKNYSAQRATRIADLEKDEAELQAKIAGYNERISNGADDQDQALKMAAALKASNRDPRSITSMLMTASQIYSMNTGDFDGDTVNAFIGMSEAFKQNARTELNRVAPEIRRQREAKLREVPLESPEESPFLSKGEGVMESWARASTATQKMAVASAALRKAQSGDPNDPTRVIALAEAMQAYDLATSDVKTKGAEFNLGSYAEKYLYSQGAHYERFIKQLQENSDDGTSTDRGGLFRFSAASTLDPEGVFAMSARRSNAGFLDTADTRARREEYIKSLTDAGIAPNSDEYKQKLANWNVNNLKQGIFDLDSYEKMENWYRSNFGAERTEEAKAARFYLDKMEDNLIWGKLWNQEDIDKGNKLIQNWGSSLDARTQAGQNVAEERARFEDFRKRMGEMVDEKGIAGTEDNVRKLAERYEKMALEEVDETKSKGYSLYAENLRRMLPESETAEERTAREAFIQTKKHSDYVWSKEVNSLVEASKDQENLDSIVQNTRIGNIVALAKGEGGRSIYNWSNVKHFVGSEQKDGKLFLDGLEKVDLNTGKSSPVAAHAVDYYKNADSLNRHMRDMILEASGEKDRTEAYRNPMTHIGQLMHSTFERVKMPQENSVYKTPEEAEAAGLQWMREAFLGMTDRDTTGHDIAALRSLGLGFIQDEKGDLRAINVGGKNRFSTNELNDYSNIVNNLLGTSDGHGGRSKGFMQRQFDELRAREAANGEQVLSIEDKLYRDGKEVSNDFGGRIYRRVVTDKEGNIVHSESSLDKDFTQSAYQTKEGEKEHIYETHAKPDYVTIDKNGKLHVYDWKSSEQGAFESIPQSMFYANMFTELGKKFHETGDQRYEQFKEWYDPKTGQSTVKTITGVNPQGGGENYNFDATTAAGREKIAEIARKVDRGMLTEEALGLAGFQDAWPYLTRIADRREEIGETVKSARQMIDNNEFSASNAEMDFFLSTYGQNKERLNQLRADVFKEHNKDTMNEYIPQDRFTKRERELKEMFSQQELAAVIANAGDSEMINSEIQKIQDTRAELLALNEADAMKAVSGDISNAKTSIRQMLTGVRPTSESNVVFGAVNALRRASETKEYLKADKQYVDDKGNFKINDANETIRNVAQARSDAYEQAVKDEQEANVFLTENLVEYTSKYEKKSNAKIDALTRTKPLDPVESFQKFVQDRQEELQKQIDQYNENVKKYDEEIKNAQNPETKASLQRLRDIDQANADRLQEFADKGGATEQAIAEQRRKLGIETETPEQQSERWLNERLAVVKTQREQALDKWFEGTGTKADYEKTFQEERMLRDQASGMKERLTRQRERQIEDYQNTLEGKQLTPAEQAERKIDNLRDQIAERRDRLGLNDPLRAQYDTILNDKAAWQAIQDRTEDEILKSRELQDQQSNFRVDQLLRQGEQLNRNGFGQRTDIIGRALTRRDQLISSRQNYKNQIDTQLAAEQKKFSGMKEGDKGYAETAAHIKDLKAASQEAGQAIQDLSGPMGTAGAVAAQFGTTIGQLAQRLGRRLFMKATQEAKRFVQEFDKSMTSIQMITLKSDSQMSTLGDGLIAKAKDLKISISEITQSAETLYRQGLSDEEVDERLDVISKFSKVSGTKVDAATKLITVAMNTGLVSNPETAADIVTALGDNAATNAAEIEKGIEKAGAAAAADGTTFAELAAMLTAITSTTQIGGNVAGRTLNTIFGRMNKIGTNELIYDENGNAVSGSAVAKLLKAQGISMYDENGNKKSSYETLYALSQKWDKMSDAEQQQIATAIAGTRQYSNFAAIMQGMSEGKVDEYMKLAGDSAGITDQKYEIYTESLAASLTNLKNTFDELIHDLTNNGTLTGAINIITGIIQGVDNLTNSVGGLGAALVTVIPMLAGLALLKAGLSTADIGLIAAGAGAIAVGGIIASSANQQTATQRNIEYDQTYSERMSTYDNLDRLKELKIKGRNRSDDENQEYVKLINDYAKQLGLTNDAAGAATYGIDSLTKALNNLSPAADEAANRVIEEAEKEKQRDFAANIVNTRGDTLTELTEGANEETAEKNKQIGLNNTLFNGRLWTYSKENGYQLRKDALAQQNKLVQDTLKQDNLLGVAGTITDWVDGKHVLSYNKDVKDPLVSLYYNAAQAGRMGDFERKTTPEQWSNRIKAGMITQEQMTAAFEYMDRSQPINSNSYEGKLTKSKDVLTRKLGAFYNEDQINFLAEKMALEWHKTGNVSAAYNNIVGEGNTFEEITSSVESALSGYKPKEELAAGGKVIYRGKTYDSEKLAKNQREIDYEAYKTEHGIEEPKYVQYNDRSYLVGRDEKELTEIREADRQAAIDAGINTLIEESYEKGYLWNGQLRSPEEISGMFQTYKNSNLNRVEEPEVYSYTSTSGQTITSTDINEVDKTRQADYLTMATTAASEAGELSRIVSENKPEDISNSVLEWYENQWGVPTYDDFSEVRKLERAKGIRYHGQMYGSMQEAEQAQIDDFWEQIGEEQEFYEIGGVRYTNKAEAIKGGREYLRKQWDENNKISEAEGVITYNGQEYESVEAAEVQRRKDFETAEENAITIATEEAIEKSDPFHAGATQGYSTWAQDKSNVYGLRADTFLRGMLSAGVNNADSLVNYIRNTEGADIDWKYLTQNDGELARLVSSMQYDENGKVVNPEVYNQIETLLRTRGRDYETPFVSTKEKATIAQGMLASLTNAEEVGYMSWEAAMEQAAEEEAANRAAYEESIKQRVDARTASVIGFNQLTADEQENRRLEYEKQIREENPYTGKTAEQIAAGYRIYSDDEKKYLKEALGDELYQKVVNKTATAEEQAYASTLIENRARGLTTLTAGQQLQGIKDVRQAIKEGRFGIEGGYSTTIADQYMSQWTGWGEYSALLQKKTSGEKLTDEETKRLSVLESSLENFQDNAEVKFEIEGVQQLEEAGKVASGTASEIKKLKKGGKVALEVTMKYRTEGFESGQQAAKLYNGTVAQQDEAAMAILGMNRDQYYANRDENLRRAKSVEQSERTYWADTWKERYLGAETDQQKEDIAAAARAAGYELRDDYVLPNGYTVDENGVVRDSRGNADYAETMRRDSMEGKKHFVYAGTPNITNVNPLIGQTRTYTDAEKNNALDQILADTMVRTNANAELYDAAVAAGGVYTQELLRRQANGETVEPWLQTAADNERSVYRTSTLSTYTSKFNQAQQAQWALSNVNAPESAGYLATFLGMNESDITSMLGSPEGKVQLQSKFNETQSAIYSEMAQALDIQLDTSDMSTMQEQLQTAADNATGMLQMFLQWMADSVDEAGNIVGNAGNKSFSEVIDESQSAEIKKRDALKYVGDIIASGNYNNLLNEGKGEGAVDYSQIDPTLLYMLNDRAKNGANSQFTQEMINNAYQNQLMGRASAPQTQQAILGHLFGGNLLPQNMIDTYQKWMKDPEKYAAEIGAFNNLEGIDEVKDALSSETNAVNKTTEAMKRYNQEIGVKGLQYANAFGDQTDEVTASLGNLAKGGKTAQKELATLSKKAYDTQDAMTAWNEAFNGGKVKSGKKVSKDARTAIGNYLGISEAEVKQLTAQDMETLFANDAVKEGIEQDMGNVIDTLMNDALSDIQSVYGDISDFTKPINIGGTVDIICDADGNINMDALISLAQAAESDAIGILQALAQGKLAEWVATLKTSGSGDTFKAWIDAKTTTNAKSKNGKYSYNNRGGGGGGGGGKSAAQQQIDASKHYVAEAQHKVNIAEADLYHPDKINDYDAYGNAIATYLYANEQLAQVQRDQIAALEAQRSKVKEGSEDWWSLTEAINGYEEALAKLEQTMDEIEKKMFEELKEQYTYKLADQDHQITMSEIDRTYYQRTNNYKAEAEEIDKNISLKQGKVRTNQEYLAELQGLQDVEYEKNGKSDYWEELQREIESVSETIGNLINDIANLNAEKLNINIEMRNNALIAPQQEATIMSYDEKILSKQNSYGALLGLYDDTLANNAKQKEILQKSLKSNEELLATQKYQSDEWYATLKEIYADQNALLELAVSDMETVEKRIDVIIEAYEKVYEELTHRENMLGIEQESLSFTNDYDKYFENLNSYIVEKRQAQDVIESEIKRLEQELTRDDLTEEAKDKIRTRINAKIEEKAKIQNDINGVWAKRLEAINEKQERELSPLQHANTMLGYQERKADRLNDYDGYINALDEENKVRKDMIATGRDQVAELKAEQALVEEGSDAWWNLQTRIEAVTQSIEDNSQAIDENNKKRIKALADKQQIEDKPQEHAFEILDIAAQRAQLLDDQGITEGVIADKIQVIKDSVAQNKDQLAELEDLLKTYVEGSEEWIEIRDKIWKTKNDNAKLENQALQLENDLAAKRLANIQKNFKRNTGTATHENAMLDTASRIYQSYSEYGNYRNVLSEQIIDLKEVQNGAIAARDAILAEMATLEKGTPAWYDARDAAYAYDEQIASTSATMLEKQQAIEASSIQEFTENYNDSQVQNNLDLAAIRATRQIMDRNGDWEGYQKAGAQEKAILEQQLSDKRSYVEGLKNLLAETTKGTAQWKSLRNTIAQELANIANMEADIDRIDHEQTQSAIDHMLERMNWEDENRKHNLSLIRYEQTKYQNAGELSNYGLMLQKEEELIRASIEAEEDNIKRLKETLSTLEVGTKEYKQIVGEIKKHEEALASDTAELQKNIKEQKENAEAILKTRKDLEDAVDKELRTREEERKKRLDAEVKLQKTILDTIKARYKGQWDLEKKDIDKKKEALEKEKALITERLNARKEAMETEEKYRELEELKRQLALISNDPTRTRDAKELRERINDIEKDISWERAFEEAETATQQIDDEIQAMSDYVTVHSDNLEEMLENANNFADQIALIMEGGWDSIADFLTTNNQEFLNSTESARQQMEEGWRETWETMTGYAKTYWDQIAEILSSYENFVAFMKDSTEYLVASDVGKQILEFGWETLYENWKNSGLISDEAENYQTDDHPWTEGVTTTTIADILGDVANDWMNLGLDQPDEAVNQMVINTYDDIGLDTKPHAVELTDLETGDTYTGLGITAAQESAAKGDGTSNNTPIVVEEPNLDGEIPEIQKPDLTDKDYEATFNYDYSGVGIQYEEEAPSSYAKVNSEAPKAYTGSSSGSRGSSSGGSGSGNTSSGKVDVIVTAVGGVNAPGATTSYSGSGSTYDAAVEDAKKKVAKGATVTGIKQYAVGGLVDYTGPAWVDGSKTKPEAFLSPVDTQMIQSLTKALNFIRVDPWTLPNPEMFANNSSTVGDINITINHAELKDDADYEDVARRVGKAFTKELSKNGFNLTGYNL